MALKTAFVNVNILKTVNQNQQTVPASLDDEVGKVLNRKK